MGRRPVLGQETGAGAPPTADITLSEPDAVPFSSAELEQALLARFGSSAKRLVLPSVWRRPAPVRSSSKRATAVASSRLVGRTGPAAARIVALVIAELLSDASDDGESDAAVDETAPAVSVSAGSNALPLPSLVTVPSPAPSRPVAPPRLCVTGGVTRGTGVEERLAYTVDADVILPFDYGGVRLAPSAGFAFTPTRKTATLHEVSSMEGIARLLAGIGHGPVDLFAGPFATRYSIEGITPHAGFLFGAEALARFSTPLSRHVRLVVAMRANAYANRVRIVFVDGMGYATPRVELSLGLGLAWDWAS